MHHLLRMASDYSGIATREHGVFSLFCAVLGAITVHLFGGWSASLSLLTWLVIGDYATGIWASTRDKTGLNSKIGFVGIPKKVLIFFFVLIGHKVDQALELNIVMTIVTYFYVTNELISITENAGRIGLPVPKKLIEIIQVLKGKIE